MIRVLIVDDSAVVRKVLSEELSRVSDIQVVGTAADPYIARDRIVQLNPDVVTLDVEMPRMDGLSFLARLMQYHPMPVIVVSSLTPEHSENALRALELGALDVIAKPGGQYSLPDIRKHLVNAIRAAASARIERYRLPPTSQTDPVAPFQLKTTRKVLAIGASTGGTQALETVLRGLPVDTPGTVVVQHMPPGFTASFARRLNDLCAMEIREASGDEEVVAGCVFIAPGNRHLVIEKSGATYVTLLKDGPPVHYQRPSVDVLFHSVAAAAGPNTVAAILTGMGADGADGMVALRRSGAHTIAQDEATCVVFGMPKEAIARGGISEVLPLQGIAQGIRRAFIAQGAAADTTAHVSRKGA